MKAFSKLFLVRIIKFAALFVPIIAVVFFAQNYLFFESNHDTMRIRHFYQEESDTLDVVVIGASEIFDGFLPVYAYEYSGLTSYKCAFASNPGSLYLPELKEVLYRQKPQAVLVEIQGFLYGEDRLNQESYLRILMENIPMSANKFETIMQHAYEDKLSCFIPFCKYHSLWQMTPSEAFGKYRERKQELNAPMYLKGDTTVTGCDSRRALYDVSDDLTVEGLSPQAYQCLLDFMEYCRAEELQNVIFMRYPHKTMTKEQYSRYCRGNRAGEIIAEAGFPFISLEHCFDEIGLDPEYDYYDPDHVNIDGAIKITEYLCDVLMDEYGL